RRSICHSRDADQNPGLLRRRLSGLPASGYALRRQCLDLAGLTGWREYGDDVEFDVALDHHKTIVQPQTQVRDPRDLAAVDFGGFIRSESAVDEAANVTRLAGTLRQRDFEAPIHRFIR